MERLYTIKNSVLKIDLYLPDNSIYDETNFLKIPKFFLFAFIYFNLR